MAIKTKVIQLHKFQDSKGRFVKGLIPWNKGLPTWTCNFCGKEFKSSTNSRAKFRYCSNFCKGKMSSKILEGTAKPFSFTKEHKEKLYRTCFKKGSIPWNKGKPNEKIRGNNHYNWRGGKAERHFNRVEWTNLRMSIIKRDKYICWKCGNTFEKNKLQVHHLLPFRYFKNNNEDILITVCTSCHKKIENKMTNFWLKYRTGGGAL